MAERCLEKLEQVGSLRARAEALRLARTRRALEEAAARRAVADTRLDDASGAERALVRQCYAAPADPQAWIAAAHHAEEVRRRAQAAEALRQEEAALAARKAAEAKAIMRGTARLTEVRKRLAAARRSAARIADEAAAEERQDSQWRHAEP